MRTENAAAVSDSCSIARVSASVTSPPLPRRADSAVEKSPAWLMNFSVPDTVSWPRGSSARLDSAPWVCRAISPSSDCSCPRSPATSAFRKFTDTPSVSSQVS